MQSPSFLSYCPLGRVGDTAGIAEEFAYIPQLSPWLQRKPHYFADGPMPTMDDRHDAGLLKRCPAASMPAWACRDTATVKGVRVVAWKDVTEAMAEAAGPYCPPQFLGVGSDGFPVENEDAYDWHPIDAIQDRLESTHQTIITLTALLWAVRIQLDKEQHDA